MYIVCILENEPDAPVSRGPHGWSHLPQAQGFTLYWSTGLEKSSGHLPASRRVANDSKLRPAGRGLQIKELATLDILKEPICGSAPFQFVCRPWKHNVCFQQQHFQQHVTPSNTGMTSQHHLMAKSKEITSLRGGLNASKYMIVQTHDTAQKWAELKVKYL